MKGPDCEHGEIASLRYVPNITVQSFGGRGWAKPGQDNTVHRLKASEALSFAIGAIFSGDYDLVVLDEVITAVGLGLLPADAIARLMAEKPAGLELIMTGRGANPEIIEKTDLVTEMRNIKHPFERGMKGRAGFEY